MRPRHRYLLLCVLGVVLPYAVFLPWLRVHGLDLRGFGAELLSTRIGTFFGLDVLVSAAALVAFIRIEGRRLAMGRLWMPLVATLLVGVSLGLPLFLYLRQVKLDEGEKPSQL